MAITDPPIMAKRTTCREMPRGNGARVSAGQSSSWICHGRSSSAGSAVAEVMDSEPATTGLAAAWASRGSFPGWT